jgi:hypothetical protein
MVGLGMRMGRVVPCDGSLDQIVILRMLNNEPERYSNHVPNSDRAVEVEIVTEHELLWDDTLALED